MSTFEGIALGLGVSVLVIAVVLGTVPWLYELGQVKGWQPLGWYDRYNDRVEAAVHGWWQRREWRKQLARPTPANSVTGTVFVNRDLPPLEFEQALDDHLESLRSAMIRDYENHG